MQQALFGGGCFWCVEAVFLQLRGVIQVTSGYAGGHLVEPSYEAVCSGNTGHAEVVKIDFDEEQVRYTDLLTVFFATHDPTTLNRQGNDIGTQYRSVIYYYNNEQKQQAKQFIEELKAEGVQVVTELTAAPVFYAAEDYHQNYFNNHPEQAYCQIVINPKVAKLKQKFSHLLV